MTADVYPLQVLLVILAGWVNRHQQHVISTYPAHLFDTLARAQFWSHC